MSRLSRLFDSFTAGPTSRAKREELKTLDHQKAALQSVAAAPPRSLSRTGRQRVGGAEVKQLPGQTDGRPMVIVRLPDGRVAQHGWQALRPTGILPLYTASHESLVAEMLDDDSLNLFGDDAGNILRHISPHFAEEEKLHYELDDRFYTTLAIKEWPAGADPRMWLRFFRELPVKIPEAQLTIHQKRIGIGLAERSMKREIDKLNVELRELREKESDTARVVDLETKIEKLKTERKAIIQRSETLFHLSAYIRIGADSLEELQERLAAVEEMCRQMNIVPIQLPGEQRDAFVSSMPYARDLANATKLRGTRNSADLLPLISAPHVERNREGKNPVVLYGIHAANWTPVIMSPFNSNETIELTTVLGKPGSGKSYWLRCHLGRMAMLGVHTMTIDPLGDFVRWHKQNQPSTIIEIAPNSPYHVNSLRREWDAKENDWEPIPDKIEHLKPLFALLLGAEWNEVASGLIGAGLRTFYERYAPEDERLMVDFINVLKEISDTAVGAFGEETIRRQRTIVDVLALKCLGDTYREFFSHKTNITVDPRDPASAKILFNLKPSGEGELLTFATYLAITMALNIAKRSLDRKILVVDEIHRLFRAQKSAEGIRDMLNDLVRTHRHWNAAAVFATQFVDEDDTNRSQSAILKGTGIWIILQGTRSMLDQTMELVKAKDVELLRSNYLESAETVDEASRREPKRMLVYRNGQPTPMLSVGLSFEDAEDDKASGVYSSRSDSAE